MFHDSRTKRQVSQIPAFKDSPKKNFQISAGPAYPVFLPLLNKKSLARIFSHHRGTKEELEAFFAATSKERKKVTVVFFCLLSMKGMLLQGIVALSFSISPSRFCRHHSHFSFRCLRLELEMIKLEQSDESRPLMMKERRIGCTWIYT